jgi:hypothetical protein
MAYVNKDMVNYIAAILCALLSTDGTPESNLYLLCDMDMQDFMVIKGMMLGADLITIKGHWVTLTANGRAHAIAIEASLDKLNQHNAERNAQSAHLN